MHAWTPSPAKDLRSLSGYASRASRNVAAGDPKSLDLHRGLFRQLVWPNAREPAGVAHEPLHPPLLRFISTLASTEGIKLPTRTSGRSPSRGRD